MFSVTLSVLTRYKIKQLIYRIEGEFLGKKSKNKSSDNLISVAPGSILILTTTSQDKKSEYRQIFSKYHVHLLFSDELGLAPQKTDEMTGSFDNNLLEKAAKTSRMLRDNLEKIEDILVDKGLVKREDLRKKGGPRVYGVCEDSGISFFTRDEDKNTKFYKTLIEKIKDRVAPFWDENTQLSDFFGDITNPAKNKIFDKFITNSNWLFELENESKFPAANYKPIFEHLPGGVREIFDIVNQAAKEVYGGEYRKDESFVVYKSDVSMALFEPSNKPHKTISTYNIVKGESTGRIANEAEIEAIYEKAGANKNTISTDSIDTNFSIPFTTTFSIPDGQKGPVTSHLSHQALINRGGLLRKNGEWHLDQRINTIENLAAKFNLHENGINKWRNSEALNISFFCEGLSPNLENEVLRNLNERGCTVTTPDHSNILKKKNSSFIPECDAIIFFPTGDFISDAQTFFAITTDKQTRPKDKQRNLIVMNPTTDGNGLLDEHISVYKQLYFDGLKNGPAEINHLVKLDTGNPDQAVVDLNNILKSIEEKKKDTLGKTEDISIVKDTYNEIESIPKDRFSVFVAGGAVNNYLGYKEVANAIGRKIQEEDWLLVYGAGHIEGCMGAAHTGYVERYLEQKLNDPEQASSIKEIINNYVTNYISKNELKGDASIEFRKSIEDCVTSGKHYKLVNYEKLALNAPDLAKELLDPKEEKHKKILGSLTEDKKIWGYSMSFLLESEGTGEPPPGCYYQDAGNMQRRMEEMLKADALTFTAGGQGTIQELVEGVIVNLRLRNNGETLKDIIILNQKAYSGNRVFDEALRLIDDSLDKKGLTREDIGLKVVNKLKDFNQALDDSSAKWKERNGINPGFNTNSSLQI